MSESKRSSIKALSPHHSCSSQPAESARTIKCENLSCARPADQPHGPGTVREFSGTFERGEIVGLCGPDGCGKGLLLNLIGLIEKADSGRLEVLGRDAGQFSEEEAATFRNQSFGFLFAHPYLLPSFTVAENLAMPLFKICGEEADAARERARDILEFVGARDVENRLAGKLDSDIRWRVAFARALIHGPNVLIAISPPAPALLPLARLAADQSGLAVLRSGERGALEPFADRIIEMREGRALP